MSPPNRSVAEPPARLHDMKGRKTVAGGERFLAPLGMTV